MTLAGCTGSGLFDTTRDTKIDNANLVLAEAAPLTPILSVPNSGSATYNGVMAASVSGAFTGSFYADLSMNLDFASNTVSGQITHADLIDDLGNTAQTLDGTLIVTGSQAGGGIAAAATGTLTGTSGPVIGAGVANFALLGTVRDDISTADTVYGSVTGAITGNYDMSFADGEFYGTTP